MKQHFRISVRGLVEHMLRAGDLSLEFAGPLRAVEGIRAHQKIQRSRPETYRSEIPVSHHAETDTLVLEIRGRIDGVDALPDRVVVEEIKSTRRPLAVLIQNENPVHWGQLKLYAYLYALKEHIEQVQTHLTYYQVDTGETRTVTRDFTFDDLKAFSTNLIQGFLEWLNMIGDWMKVRDDSIQTLTFPFPEYRQGQREMAVAVYRTVRDRKQLLVQAPTGIGKTMAALFPALKAMGEAHISKWFYLTARTTGRMAAETAVDTLRQHGLRFKSLTLTAKDKICPHPETACDGEFCPRAKGYYDRINTVLKTLFQEKSRFTREDIETAAQAHEICPFELSLDLSLWVDGIICDYNYAFDPR
ncbi:MAG: PD-(D/E)XK nuclease family protein, partial [Thermodesulfobacteriota bacterium]